MCNFLNKVNFYATMLAMCFKKKYLSCVFCLLSFVSFSQNTSGESSRTIDSLKLALKNAKHDTTRCNILNVMIEAEDDDNIWSKYNEQLKKLAEKNIASSQKFKNIYLKHLANAISNMAVLYQSEGDLSKGLESLTTALKIQEKIDYKAGIAASLNKIGIIYDYQGDLNKALECYERSLIVIKEIGDKNGVAHSLNNIGYTYIKRGNIKGLDYLIESLKIYEEINDKNGTSSSLINLGYIYENQGDLPNALIYYQKSLNICEELGNKIGVAKSLNNMGTIYRRKSDFKEALNFYERSLKIYEELGDKGGIANSLINIGGIYQNYGVNSSMEGSIKAGYSKALECFKKSIILFEELGDKNGTSKSLNFMSRLMLKTGNVNEAFLYGNSGYIIAKELGYPINIKESASTLKIVYQKQNKYKEAFEMFELEIKMRDSINNQETQKVTVKKQMQYAYEKKELEAKAEQDKKDTVAKAELKQKENERNYFIVGFGLVLVLALFILRGYKQKQKANAIILQQKDLVDEKQKEIIDSIYYAKRIQTALLPSEKYIDKNLKQLNKA